jgi:hypothetical protein
MEKKNIITNIILPEDVWEEAKIRAAKNRISLSEVVRRSLIKDLIEQDSEIKRRRGKDFGKARSLRSPK